MYNEPVPVANGAGYLYYEFIFIFIRRGREPRNKNAEALSPQLSESNESSTTSSQTKVLCNYCSLKIASYEDTVQLKPFFKVCT
jgi:hypothetical protein